MEKAKWECEVREASEAGKVVILIIRVKTREGAREGERFPRILKACLFKQKVIQIIEIVEGFVGENIYTKIDGLTLFSSLT